MRLVIPFKTLHWICSPINCALLYALQWLVSPRNVMIIEDVTDDNRMINFVKFKINYDSDCRRHINGGFVHQIWRSQSIEYASGLFYASK